MSLSSNEEADALRLRIIDFLAGNPHIARLEFTFKTYRVSPAAYKRDVLNAIKNNDIEVEVDSDIGQGVAAAYQSRWLVFWDDRFKFRPGFTIASARDQATLIHECTHAYFDFLALGTHARPAEEGAAYVAEYVFWQASGDLTIARRRQLRGFFAIASQIAEGILSGSKVVPDKAADDLVSLLARDPRFQKPVRSDGV